MPPTLSLCLITYQNDIDDLNQCLAAFSVVPNLFDSIHVTDTTPSGSCEAVKSIVANAGAHYSHLPFQEDFSAVRNFNFDQSHDSHILWVDSDDRIMPATLQELLKFKPKLLDLDVVLLDYQYASDAQGNPTLLLPRERIVKNCPEHRWKDRIHEYITFEVNSRVARLGFRIIHTRTRPLNPERNLKILRETYAEPDCSERSKFYFAKELYDYGKFDEAIPALESYVSTGAGKDFVDNLSVACIKLSQYYGYQKNYIQAQYWAVRGLRFNGNYSELWTLAGMARDERKLFPGAMDFFRRAITCTPTNGMSQLLDFYHYLPARFLSILAFNSGNIGEARHYAIVGLGKNAGDQQLSEIKEICGEIKVVPVWLFPGRMDPTNGSQRIRRLNLGQAIPDSRFIENYLDIPFTQLVGLLRGSTVAVFQNFCEADLWLMQMLKGAGIRVIFDDCENISGFPFQHECMAQADLITCCSNRLAEERQKLGYKRIGVIPDAYEPCDLEPVYDRPEPPTALFIGMGGNSWLASSWLRDTVESAGYRLKICTEWDDADVKWGLDTWQKTMLDADVILCPQRSDIQPAKSAVKMTQAMSMGLPAIGSNLPAYNEIVKQGINGYIADDLSGWKAALEELKDPEKRKAIGTAARKSVLAYGLDSVASRWVAMVTQLLSEEQIQIPQSESSSIPDSPQQKPIDIIIPNYRNWEYLRLCLDSILMHTTNYRIIISDAGSDEETWTHLRALKGFTVLGAPNTRLSFSQACNAGISIVQSDYFVILNSDVIVSRGWLDNILSKMQSENRLASCGVLSNCDSGWLINAPGKPTIDLKISNDLILRPGMKIDEVSPNFDTLYSFMQKSNKQHAGEFVEQQWVASYCTCYATSAIKEIGGYDPLFNNGCEDLDLEKRLHAFGFRSGQAYDAFIFHFGGISRGAYQSEDVTAYNAEDRDNHRKFADKWSKPRVAIYTGPAWEPWTWLSVANGMAGSESWATYAAEEFATRGYEVTIYGHLEDPNIMQVYDGVRYIDHRKMLEDLQYKYVDLFISSRTCEPLTTSIHALKSHVMVHDIWLSQDPNYDTQSWRVSKFLCLSDWHKQFLMQHHKIPVEKIQLTANGVSPYYSDVDMNAKRNMTVYSSSPDRGLYQLLLMLPAIRESIPEFDLHICYGFFNWESAVKARNDTAGMALIEKIKSLMEQPGVVYHGRVSKEELARLQKLANIWLFPTWFSETFCITAVENGLCRNPIITTDLAGLQTTVGDAGIMLPADGLSRDEPYPKTHTTEFIRQTVAVLKDPEFRRNWGEKAYNKMRHYTWGNIVDGILNEEVK